MTPSPAARLTGPVARAAGRVEAVDVLRGFALGGICLVNAQVIAGTFTPSARLAAGPVDHAAEWLVTLFLTTKFYLLFAFLFGYSFTLMTRAAERRGADVARVYGRRLLGLLLIGCGHAVLLYPGDILMTYAVLGLPLFAVRGWRPRRALRAAALLIAALTAIFLVIALCALYTSPAEGGLGALGADNVAAYRGGPLDIVGAHIRQFRAELVGAVLYAGHLFAGFLAGMAVGKWRLLEDPYRHTAALRRLAVGGLAVGLPGGVFMAMCENGPLDARYFYLGRAVGIVTAPAQAAACGCLLLLWTRAHGGWVRAALARAGRLALTNYLSQSLVLALLFTGYGLGWYGRVGAAGVTVCGLSLYTAQLLLSGPILARYGSGPAERLLRRLTYGPAARP
ncbi:DUF418 domain-containing protein [Streptomyces sp. AK02-01A]|uniref:DUF418 domain-containing protein n=1 Tax=Streptomyces sp. AK02-01A TaxID=3028648 RepID=UPI0029AFF854|nr:DUF418 domain-containing protein [Streptomyces sp. AK02-01A]MDX3850985.1 DUF418 domain-containing protein [Streptomyces sp. AK02-01A]